MFKESRDQMRQEQYLYYIVDDQVQKDTALYKQCLEEGIRLDRQRFLCVLLEDVMENSQVYQYFSEGFRRYREHSDIYSLYIMGDKYVFLICSDLERDRLLSGHKVGEVVEKLGYGSATAFTAAFKRYYDMTPQAFRAKGKASSEPSEDDS